MVDRDPEAGFLTLLGRGLRRRCPRCGEKAIFSSWAELAEWCPRCGLGFEREDGYWVGAMIIDTAVTFALFLVVLVGGMAAFWPEVPWTGLTVATVAVMALTPILFYPRSKTLWMAIELSYHPLEPHERTAATQRAQG